MKKKIKIDIILPNYNSSDFIKDTLKSIISQTYKNWNLIIVDDCSNQKTRNILKKYHVEIDIVDPSVDKDAVKERYDIEIFDKVISGKKYTAVISSVAHKEFIAMSLDEWEALIKEDGILYDLKGFIPRELKTLRI